ncbi:hypothetical protein [Tenacibaculum sp. C7A-26P2]|uniref:hypothetical protein n=1 Tax=Tenacibaculum sp. C7A-26P2 TaxID=3447504 RepID=UPI003F87D89D
MICQVAKKVKISFLIIFTLLSISGTFFHYFQEKVPRELAEHRKTFIPEIKNARINSLIKLKEKLISNEISINKFSSQFDKSIKKSEQKEKEYYNRKREILEKHSYFNFQSKRQFTFMLSLICLLVFTSILSIFSNHNKDIMLRKIASIASYCTGSISLFWLFWVFFNSIINENNLLYLFMFLTFSLIVFFIIFKTIKLFASKKLSVQILVDFIYRARNKHYPEIASKALHAEMYDEALKNGKSVASISENFDNDLLNTLEHVIENG